MQKLKSVLVNDRHKIHRNFEILDQLIPTRRPDLLLINKNFKKRTCPRVDFSVPTDHRVKIIESKTIYKYLDFEIRRRNEIVKNGLNTEKRPGELRRLVVTQIPVKDYNCQIG